MTNKKTKKDYFNAILNNYPANLADYDEVMAFVQHEIDLLDKKNATRKPSPKVIAAREEMDARVREIFVNEPNAILSAKEIGEMLEVSFQKVVRPLNRLADNGELLRETVKNHVYYRRNVEGV